MQFTYYNIKFYAFMVNSINNRREKIFFSKYENFFSESK